MATILPILRFLYELFTLRASEAMKQSIVFDPFVCACVYVRPVTEKLLIRNRCNFLPFK